MTLSLLAVAAFAACASTVPASRVPLDRTFAEIQVHEAGIEHARANVARPEMSCDQRCNACASASDHADRLCELARQAPDTDTLTRCERARHARSDISASTRAAGCACAVAAR